MTAKQKDLTFMGAFIFLLVVLDIVTKRIAYNSLLGNPDIHILGDFFKFKFIWNPGSAFGLLHLGTAWFVIINLIITGAGGYYFFVKEKENKLYQYMFLAIVAGGWGNVIDRFTPSYDGKVVDFISFGNFPVFNLADVWVVCGSFGLAALLFIDDFRKKKNEK